MGQIELRSVKKQFGAVQVIKDISLSIDDGEFVVFVGPSGCGKSTLLRLISGLETMSEGSVLIDEVDVSEVRPADRNLAMVFQSYALFPHISVRENIGFGLKISGRSKKEIDKKVISVAATLDLSDLLDRKPKELSGGQQQRVAIGRAIVKEPAVFLFDEPLSNLDAALRVQTRIELIKLHSTLGATMVYVTHDQVEAMTMADRIVVLKEGAVEQFDTPVALYDRPANLFVAGFIGSPKMNFIKVDVSDDGKVRVADRHVCSFPKGYPLTGRDYTLGVRPEHVSYSATKGDWEGFVDVEEQLGSDAFLYVTTKEFGQITVRAVNERAFKRGDNIFLSFDPEKIHLFDGDGSRVSDPIAT